MHFKKCIASKQGLFENVNLVFSENVNIIYGKNGSGKTMLAKCFIEALWRWHAGKEPPVGEAYRNIFFDLIFSLAPDLTFNARLNNGKYLLKGGPADDEIISLEETGRGRGFPEQTGSAAADELKKFFERTGPEIFLDVSFIPSPTDMPAEKMINYSSLKDIILDDNSEFYSFYYNFRNTFEMKGRPVLKLFSEIARYENLLKDLDKRIKLIDIQESRIEKLHREKKSIINEMEKLDDTLAGLGNQKSILGKMNADLVKIEQLNRDLEKIKGEVFGEQEKIKSIANLKSEMETHFPQLKDMQTFDSRTLDEMQHTFIEIRNLNEKIDRMMIRREGRKNRLKKIAIAVNISAAAAVFYNLIENAFNPSRDIIFLASVFGFAFAATLGIIISHLIQSREKHLKELMKEKETLDRKMKELFEKSKINFDSGKIGELFEFLLQYFEDYIEYSERIEDFERLKRTVKDKKYFKSIREKLDLLKEREEAIKDEINQSIISLDLKENIEINTLTIHDLITDIDREIEEINGKIETKKSILNQIEGEISADPMNHETKLDLIKKRNDISEKLKTMITGGNSLNFIMQIVAEAVGRREQKQLRRLVNATYAIFHYLTDNQYVARIDEGVIQNSITGDTMPGDLNPAVMHLLLLALKLSLTEILDEQDLTLPLIIDDPLLYMDDERIEKMKEAVLNSSEKRQIIIFTHNSNIKSWGNFLEL